MGNQDHERQVFGAFLKFAPKFAGEEIREWDLADVDPPDIKCTTATGRTVGVELKELVLGDGIQTNKPRDSFVESLHRMADDLGTNPTQNVDFFRYVPHEKSGRVRLDDIADFVRESLEFAKVLDAQWNPEWNIPTPHRVDTTEKPFKKAYPTLAKYVKQILAKARFDRWGDKLSEPSSFYWIGSSRDAYSYDPKWFGDRLTELLGDTVAKYNGFDLMYDEVSLLVHADDNALLYNPPRTEGAAGHGALRGRRFLLEHGTGPFAKVFLFIWIDGEEQVTQLYPLGPET